MRFCTHKMEKINEKRMFSGNGEWNSLSCFLYYSRNATDTIRHVTIILVVGAPGDWHFIFTFTIFNTTQRHIHTHKLIHAYHALLLSFHSVRCSLHATNRVPICRNCGGTARYVYVCTIERICLLHKPTVHVCECGVHCTLSHCRLVCSSVVQHFSLFCDRRSNI